MKREGEERPTKKEARGTTNQKKEKKIEGNDQAEKRTEREERLTKKELGTNSQQKKKREERPAVEKLPDFVPTSLLVVVFGSDCLSGNCVQMSVGC